MMPGTTPFRVALVLAVALCSLIFAEEPQRVWEVCMTFDPQGWGDDAEKVVDEGARHKFFSLPRPANDSCALAHHIDGFIYQSTWTESQIQGAETDDDEPQESCEFLDAGSSNSIWFAYSPPVCGTLSLNTNGSDYDTILSVFGCSCDQPHEVACDDDGGTGTRSQILDVPVFDSQDYLIKVAEFGSLPMPDAGHSVLNVWFRPFAGDFDGDCDFDLEDIAEVVLHCPMGPGNQVFLEADVACLSYDDDHDVDFDLADVAEVMNGFLLGACRCPETALCCDLDGNGTVDACEPTP